MNIKSSLLMAGLAVGVAVPTVSIAAPISAGNLVIYRVGNGSAALGTAHTAVFLDEYTTGGTLVQSIAVSTTGASALTASGNATTEGILSLSQDGTKICMTGYRKDAGVAFNAAAANKVIGFVDATGTVNTGLEISDFGGSAPRSATTLNGSTFYMSGATNGTAGGGVRYVATNTGIATSTLIDFRNSRQVQMYGGSLYASNGSTSITGKMQSYGPSPTGATAATPIITAATANAVNGFIMMTMTPGGGSVDTAYALDTVANALLKWNRAGTVWTQTSSTALAGTQATAATNLIGIQTGTSVDLYMTTASKLVKLTDATGFGGAVTGTSSLLATAGTNTAFRGINSFNSVPEPASLVALGLGLALALRKRK